MKHLTNQKTAPIVEAAFLFAFYFLSCYNFFGLYSNCSKQAISLLSNTYDSLFGANCQTIYFEEAVFMAMKKLPVVEVQGVRGYVDKNNVAWLNAEDIARKLGFVDYQEKVSATSGRKTYEVIRWARINGYLREFEPLVKGTEISALLSKGVGAGDYIPENLFYLLAMKANNEAARDFQWKVASEILPSIRRDGFYSVYGKELNKLQREKKSLEQIRDDLKSEQIKFEFARQRLYDTVFKKNLVMVRQLEKLATLTTDDDLRNDLIRQALDIICAE